MATFLGVYYFEDDAGVEHEWDVWGAYCPGRPPAAVSIRNYDATFCDPGDPPECEIEYAEEGKKRVPQEELNARADTIAEWFVENPPENEDYQEDDDR